MVLTRRNFLAAPALLQAQRRKPNVVLLLPDQFRAQALGSMGDPNVRTPHMDRLASDGVRFTNTVANSPVCCPARAILATGQYCHRNGMVANDLRLRESATGIASVLSAAGYRTGFVGKWHLDGGPRLPGFVPPGPRRHGFEYWAANQCSHQHFDTHYFRDNDQPIPIHKFEAEGWTDLGIEFLEASKRDTRPFFLNVFMGPPHDPYGAPKPYMDLYQPEKLKLRPNWAGGEKIPGRAEIAAYYAAVTAVDDQVGRILKSLDDLGLADDTVVLLSSDHGDMLGSQGQRLKRKPWDESILVPGLFRYPRGAKGGRTDDLLFSHIDFMPTILGLCGVNQPVGLQGKDLSSVLLTGDGARPDSAFLQIFGPYDGDGTPEGWLGVRTSRYTYARFKNRPWVLYDNQADPYQQNNLAPDPAARKLLTQMDDLTGRWMKSTGDAWSFNWTAKVEDAGRLYQERTFYTVDEYLRAQ